MTSKERVLQYIDYKHISNRKFCIEIGVSHTYFSKEGAMGSDVLMKISTIYPELNMDWVITGRGEMLNTEPIPPKEKDWKAEHDKLRKEFDLLKDKYIICLEERDSFKQTAGLPVDVRKP